MYLRTTTRRASDGTVVRYVQLAHNRRVNGVTQAQVLVNLGREEHLDPEGLRRLVGSIRRWLGDTDGVVAGDRTPPQVLDVRPLGTVWLLDGLWKAARVDRALAAGADRRRWTSDAERVAFACTAVRAVEPALADRPADWVGRCVAVPGLDVLTPGEPPAVAALVAAADLDVLLGALAGRRPPVALEAFRGTAERVAFGGRVLGWLAAALVATVEERTGTPWALVRADLDRLAAVRLGTPDGTATVVTRPDAGQAALFAACGVGVPPPELEICLGR